MSQVAGQPGTAPGPGRRFSLSQPLVRLTPSDVLTLRDALEGVHIFGGLGSGKTSGSGQTIARAFLQAGYGGLVLTGKPDEAETWERYCRETGRASSLIRFGPGRPWKFNFIDYEMRRPGPGAGITSNLVSLFEEVLEVHHPGKVLGGDPYWREARSQLLRNAIDLIKLAGEKVTMDDVAAVIRSAPQSLEQAADDNWRAGSRCARLLRAALDHPRPDPTAEGDLHHVATYFLDEFAKLDPKPRSSVVSMVGALTDTLLRGDVRELLLTKTTIVPEVIEQGVVLVLDMPVHVYREAGRFVQVLFKTIFQRMVERRDAKPDTTRPVFLWADEAQLFTSGYDPTFQTTARSTKTATVYLSQNLPNYYDAFGGDAAGASRTKKLLGAFGIKVFHANGDTETNEYAEQLCGRDVQRRASYGVTYMGAPSTPTIPQSTSHGYNEQVESLVPARVFTELMRGGYNRNYTEAIVFRAGEPWRASGRGFMRCKFRQSFPPSGRRPNGAAR